MLGATLSLPAQKEATITVQADKGTDIIPKEIYGQFAEHLGSCIYGGIWVGENSDTSVEATGSSAPNPNPMMKRAISSATNVQEQAIPAFAKPKMTYVAVNTVFRPTRSAKYPPNAAPIAMPTNPTDNTHDFSVAFRLKCGSAAMAATTNETNPTSMASKAQPMPEATNNLRCAALNGRRSSRAFRLNPRSVCTVFFDETTFIALLPICPCL